MKTLCFAVLMLFSCSVFAQNKQCLIVRQSEGHRFRNGMIAGVLTGGIGLAAGLAFSGGRYEYVDSFNMTDTKMKYKGPELKKLQDSGVHIVVVNKKAAGDEIKSARDSCNQPPAAPSTPAVAKTDAPQTADSKK